MTTATISKTARPRREQGFRERRGVWPWSRWRKWTREEIATVGERAGVCYACDGEGCELRWFET